MSNSFAFVGVGMAMGALRFMPGVNPVQLAWLAVMGVVNASIGVVCACRIVWRATAAVMTRRVRAARTVRVRTTGAVVVPDGGGVAQVV